MCPVCLSTAALIVSSFASTGGAVAVAVKTFGEKRAAASAASPTQIKEDDHD
jgi:hypothetical protein